MASGLAIVGVSSIAGVAFAITLDAPSSDLAVAARAPVATVAPSPDVADRPGQSDHSAAYWAEVYAQAEQTVSLAECPELRDFLTDEDKAAYIEHFLGPSVLTGEHKFGGGCPDRDMMVEAYEGAIARGDWTGVT